MRRDDAERGRGPAAGPAAPPKTGLEQILEEEALGKALDRALLRRLWRHVNPYRWQVVATLLLVAPLFLFELAPAWILKTGLDRLAGAETPGGALGRLLAPPAGVSPWVWLPGLFLVTGVLRAGFEYAQTLLIAATGQAAMRDLRQVVFDHTQQLHQGFFDRYPVGRLVTRCTSDVEPWPLATTNFAAGSSRSSSISSSTIFVEVLSTLIGSAM